MLRTNGSYANQKFSIIVKGVEGRKLILPIMHFQPHNDMPAIRIAAAEAELKSDLSRRDGSEPDRLRSRDVPNIHSFFPANNRESSPWGFSPPKVCEGSPTNLPLRQITTEVPPKNCRIELLG